MNRSLNIFKTTISGLVLAACSLFYSNAYAKWCTGNDFTCWGTAQARQEIEDAANRGRNNGGGSAPVYIPTKPSKYGAVAMDKTTGSIGVASMQPSKSAAKRAAILDCGGGYGCKIISAYANTCMAIAQGSSGFLALENKQSLEMSEKSALNVCSEKTNNCQVFLSECSLP